VPWQTEHRSRPVAMATPSRAAGVFVTISASPTSQATVRCPNPVN
jgi:hypothetical protein